MIMRAQQVTGPEVFHGEGPVWHPGWGGLRFVDMLAGDVMTLRADGGLDRKHVGSVAAIVRPRVGGGAKRRRGKGVLGKFKNRG